MKTISSMVMGLAVAASVVGLMGCEGDPSAPRRPRTQLNPLGADEKGKDNAEKRELEKPDRSLPTSGKEFPTQSNATPSPSQDASVPTASACVIPHKPPVSGVIPPNGTNARFGGKLITIGDYQYPGPLAPLPLNPGSAPLAGAANVPYSQWTVENSWGQGMVLTDYPHRDFAPMQTVYMAANVKHNPVYYNTIRSALPVPQNDNSYGGNWGSTLLEVPFFYVQTLVVPVMMAMECPWRQVTTQRLGADPNFLGYLPPGATLPGPLPGVIRWDYPFLYADQQTVTSMRAADVILPTPGVRPAPLDLPSGPVTRPAPTPSAD